jgi:hypothetical protein
MEIDTEDPFIGHNQRGRKTDITQRANLPRTDMAAWGNSPPRPTIHSYTPNYDGHHPQRRPPTQTYAMSPNNSPTQGDKYITLHTILQAGIAALDNLDITDQEEIPKDITALIHIISKKPIITTPVHNTKTIED